MSKRPFNLASLNAKKAKLDGSVSANAAATGASAAGGRSTNNPFLRNPVQAEQALQKFLVRVRTAARNYLPAEQRSQIGHLKVPFCEVEARLGILKVQHAAPDRRVTSTGAKKVNGRVAPAFDCSHATGNGCTMASGVSRTAFVRSTGTGISEVSPLSQALGVTTNDKLKHDLVETEMVETVYTGYSNDGRCCFDGEHDGRTVNAIGKMESKEKLVTLDLTIPAASFDLRVTLSSEKVMDPAVRGQPPSGWKSKRIKRRRSYTRRDKSIAWQIDVTEVTTTTGGSGGGHDTVDYEVEMELLGPVLLQLINEQDDAKVQKMAGGLATQLWWVLKQINPLADALDVEECLRDHPNRQAVQLALAQCGVFKKYMDQQKHNTGGERNIPFESPIANPNSPPSAALTNVKFVGCMPVNFSRHNIEQIQRGSDNSYYLSEKTDGVRYFMVFTGDTVVLVDRAMRGKQPIPVNPEDDTNKKDPMASILDLIKPGTVFDGEVVMNRHGRKPRPIFIVFDVMAISTTEAVLHLPFEQRLKHLKQATFRTPTARRDMFDPRFVSDASVALPLVRKNFVKRTDVDTLLSHVVEERGMRTYRNGELHNHLTDGIIFQPNLPYVCGTDTNLLKWKYLDTATIDVELLPPRHNDDDENILRVGCLGEEQTRVDMTRYVLLPRSERMRLEADKFESGGRIAEVGFDPETGEWYYLMMRGDKIAPNHISTVLGTMLELAESLTTDELRYRMSVPAGQRDTYRKDMRGMLKQLLDHQRKKLRAGPK